MIEALEGRIKEHIEYLLSKDVLDYPDYLIITSEISRLEQKEQAKSWAKSYPGLMSLLVNSAFQKEE